MPKMTYQKSQAIIERQELSLKNQPTQLRRCLSCEDWMHSTGPDHRICNPCKGGPSAISVRVGARVNPVGRRRRRRTA